MISDLAVIKATAASSAAPSTTILASMRGAGDKVAGTVSLCPLERLQGGAFDLDHERGAGRSTGLDHDHIYVDRVAFWPEAMRRPIPRASDFRRIFSKNRFSGKSSPHTAFQR